MRVTVVPKRPINGILPKNKWVDTKMELDLNKNEILHCMKFGTVYDENGKVIDSVSIKNVPARIKPITSKIIPTKPVIHDECIKEIEHLESVTTTAITDEPIVINVENAESITGAFVTGLSTTPIVEKAIETEVIETEPVEEEKHYCELELVSYTKEDDFVILEAKLNSDYTLGGVSTYGLFTITSGSRPTCLEYKSEDNWVKFSNKFANLDTLVNGDTFVFRFIPNGEFTYRISIKSKNDVIVKLEDKFEM